MPASENLKRVMVAVIAIPLILITAFLGGYYFFTFVALVALISFYEFALLARKKNANANIILSELIIFLLLLNVIFNYIELTSLLMLASLSLLIAELFRNKGSAINNLGASFLGLFYIGFFSTSLILLREFYTTATDDYSNGAFLIISVLASIWIGDSAAYYGGTALGKHKLFPRVSPKKSWEGAIFGFIFSIGTMILMKFLLMDFQSLLDAVIIGIIIGIVGQTGDLVESLLKRDSEVKDSSSLIPGHGGFLDRFDSLIFSAPVIWMYLKYFG
jgi:phosphatidate cytidylyltransferase